MRAVAVGSYLKTCHVWFEQIDSIECLNRLKLECRGCDLIIIHGNKCVFDDKGIDASKQESLISDLSQTDEQLLNLMTKTIRNEINRAERERVEVEYYSSLDLMKNHNVLETFSNMFHGLYKQKGIEGMIFPIKELEGYIKAGQLLVSVALIDGKPEVFHSYVFGEGNSRFLHSCSEFRDVDNNMRNSIGRANKYLHWKDFQQLRKLNVKNYDWGGISSLSRPNGIDIFKLSFGAEPVEYYNVTVSLTLRHRMYKRMSSFWHQGNKK